MKNLTFLLLILALITPTFTFAEDKIINQPELLSFCYQKIIWTFQPEVEDEVASKLCNKISNLASKSIIQRNKVAMEEISLAHEGLTYDGYMKKVKQVLSSYVTFAPLRPAEFVKINFPLGIQVDQTDYIKGNELLQLDDTSMAVQKSRRREGNSYGDHIGAYNFIVEISGVAACKKKHG